MNRLALITLLVVAVAGCKFTVLVPRGGEVQSVASGTCLELTNCIHDITDSTYSESFTAVPAAGFEFLRWNAGDDFLCKDSTDPLCVIDNTVLAGIFPDKSIQRYKDLYIMPIFGAVELPDVILADGKEWAIPVFVSLGDATLVAAIDAVCPISNGGVCSGTYEGFVLDGWTWASIDDMTALFNSFLPGSPLGPAPSSYTEATHETAWGDALFAAGFPITEGDGVTINAFSGLTRTTDAIPLVDNRIATWIDGLVPPYFFDEVYTSFSTLSGNFFGGPVFYRTP